MSMIVFINNKNILSNYCRLHIKRFIQKEMWFLFSLIVCTCADTGENSAIIALFFVLLLMQILIAFVVSFTSNDASFVVIIVCWTVSHEQFTVSLFLFYSCWRDMQILIAFVVSFTFNDAFFVVIVCWIVSREQFTSSFKKLYANV